MNITLLMHIVVMMELSTFQHHNREIIWQIRVRLLPRQVVVSEPETVQRPDLGHDDAVVLLLGSAPDDGGAGELVPELLVQQEDGEGDTDVPDVTYQGEHRPRDEDDTKTWYIIEINPCHFQNKSLI